MKYISAVLLALLLFTSSVYAKDKNCFFFVQIADTQLGMSTGTNDMTIEISNFTKAVEQINRLKPAFVIISGDLINAAHDPKQIRAFWNVAHGINKDIPLYLVAGNHDIAQGKSTDIASYQKLFGKDHYAFSYNGSEFIVLNSIVIFESNNDPAYRDTQRKWFEEELATAQKKNPNHIFVCAHHPWFLKSPDEKDEYFNIPQSQRQDYLSLMKHYDVDYALAGHYHKEAFGQDGKLTMITTSSLGKALGKDPVGFRIFKVYKDRVEHTYYPLDKVPEKINL